MEALELNNPINSVCRTCLKSNRKFFNIFNHTKNDRYIIDMLMDCVNIKVETNDGLPANICSPCLRKLSSASNFRQMAIDCDLRLHNYYQAQTEVAVDVEEPKHSYIKNETLNQTVAKVPQVLHNYNCTKGDDLRLCSYNQTQTESTTDREEPKHSIVKNERLHGTGDDGLQVLSNSDSTKGDVQCNINTLPTDDGNEINSNNLADSGEDDQSSHEIEITEAVASPLCDGEGTDFTNDYVNEQEEDDEEEKNISNLDEYKRRKGRKEQDQKTLLCKYCKKLFSLRYYFDIHIHQHTGNTPYKCDLCDKRFVKRSMLNKHMRIHSDKKPFQCNMCGKRFKYISNLHNHVAIHSEQKPYKCDICNKGFKVQGGLKIHLRRHAGERPYICEICGKSYICQGDLVLHIGTHDTTKNFTCPKCGKTFASKISLKVHMKRHSNNKPYACDRCNKNFSTNAILQRHILIHTGEKPYSCNLCGKSFRQSACIPRHMRIHTGETPFPCEQCPSKFKYKHHLLNHMKTHT